jgi:hypothetical protein
LPYAYLDDLIVAAAVDLVGAAVGDNDVKSGTAIEGIVPGCVGNLIVADAAVDSVVAGSAIQEVVVVFATKRVVAVVPECRVASEAGGDRVVAFSAVDCVGLGCSAKRVVLVREMIAGNDCDGSPPILASGVFGAGSRGQPPVVAAQVECRPSDLPTNRHNPPQSANHFAREGKACGYVNARKGEPG